MGKWKRRVTPSFLIDEREQVVKGGGRGSRGGRRGRVKTREKESELSTGYRPPLKTLWLKMLVL